MNRKYFSAMLAFAVLFIASCTKDSGDPLPTDNPGAAPTPTFIDGTGAMAAVQTTTYVTVAGMTIPTEINTAAAAFRETAASATMIDAGTVTLNGKALKKYDNNAYVYENLLDPLSFSTLKWDVAGSGSIPAISATVTRGMPVYTGFSTLPSDISLSAGLTLNMTGQLTGADSLYVVLLDMSSGSVIKKVKGSSSTVVFSASELSGLKTGQGFLEIVPWNFTEQTFSGKKFYFVNEAAYIKSGVTIK